MFYRHCAAKKEACIRSQANENTLYRELPRKAKKYGLNVADNGAGCSHAGGARRRPVVAHTFRALV